jgi:hypothetical protein
MGMRMPETCWAVSKQVINLRSCCILLVDSVGNWICLFSSLKTGDLLTSFHLFIYPKRIQCSVQSMKFQDVHIHCQHSYMSGLSIFNNLSSKVLSIYVFITVWQIRSALKRSYAFLNWSSSERIRNRNIKICYDRTRTIAGCLLLDVSLLNYSFFTPARNI